MSVASSPASASISARISLVHGSAPKMPYFSEQGAGSIPWRFISSSCRERSSSSDAVSIGSSSPGGVAAAVMAVSSRVVVDGDVVGAGYGLAGQDVAGVDFALLEGVVAAHGRRPPGDLRAAGAADAALAGERQVGPDLLGAVEDRRAGREREGGRPPVEDDGHAGAVTDRRLFTGRFDGRLVADPEQLTVHAAGGHAELAQHLGRASDQPERSAQPPVAHVADTDGQRQQPPEPVAVEAPGVQLDLLRLAGEDMD